MQFLEDQQAILTHFKFNFVLTVIYESPLVKTDDDDEKSVEKHETYRKGTDIFIFLRVHLFVT